MKKKPKPTQTELFKEEVDDYLPFVFTDEEEKMFGSLLDKLITVEDRKEMQRQLKNLLTYNTTHP